MYQANESGTRQYRTIATGLLCLIGADEYVQSGSKEDAVTCNCTQWAPGSFLGRSARCRGLSGAFGNETRVAEKLLGAFSNAVPVAGGCGRRGNDVAREKWSSGERRRGGGVVEKGSQEPECNACSVTESSGELFDKACRVVWGSWVLLARI